MRVNIINIKYMDSQNNSHQEPAIAPQGDAGSNKLMAALAYVGPLIIVSYLTSKDNPVVKFHIKQGLVILCIEVGIWLVSSVMMYQLMMILNILNLATLVLSIIGIVNVVKGEQKELPVVGGFSKHFNF